MRIQRLCTPTNHTKPINLIKLPSNIANKANPANPPNTLISAIIHILQTTTTIHLATHQDLFQKMLQGDESSLKQLLGTYHNYLLVVGLRYLTDKGRVQDVIHDVFADLWNQNKEIEVHSGVKSFLRGAVINKCLAIIRKDKKMDYVDDFSSDLRDQAPSADQVIHADQLKEVIEKVVSQLPEKCQQVFRLSRYEGKSHREIAEQMSISKKTIENHMTRALKALKTELKRKELLTIMLIMINNIFH